MYENYARSIVPQHKTMNTTHAAGKKSHVNVRDGANKTPKIYNGRMWSANAGYRQLSFKENGDQYVLMPVPFLAGNGNPGEVATTQEIGDLTIRYSWNETAEWLNFLIYPNGKDKEPIEYQLHEAGFLDVWKTVQKQHPWVSEFLERQVSKNTASIIPVSIIPADEYEANKKKAADVKAFNERFGIKLPFNTNDIPLQNLQLIPGPPLDFKEYVPTNVENIDGTPGRIERWYSSMGAGALEVSITPRLLRLNPNRKEDDIELAPGKPGVPFSTRARVLIRVVVGASLSQRGVFFGGSVHAYNLNWRTGAPPKYALPPPPKAEFTQATEDEADPRPLLEEAQEEVENVDEDIEVPTNPHV